MNSKLYRILLFTVVFQITYSCTVIKPTNQLNVTSLGGGKEGTSLVKSWGEGRTVRLAMDDARKKAIKALLFKGIPGSEVAFPIITDPNAENTFKDFFERFFSNNGDYMKYLTDTDESIDPENRIRNGNLYKIAVIVSIHKNLLINRMENEGIIKKIGL